MNISEYKNMYLVEKEHWWFKSKRAIITYLLRDYADSSVRALDFGCGTGALLEELSNKMDIEGVDSAKEAIEYCQKRGQNNVRLINEDFHLEGRYSVIIASDVLEHIEDDVSVMKKLWGSIEPGGIFLVTVPAFQFLWSSHDEALHHKRRYSRVELINHLHRAGILPDYVSYFNMWLFPVAAAIRLFQKTFEKKDQISDSTKVPPKLINQLLFSIFQSEKKIIGKRILPFGLSVIAIARKK